MKWIEILQILSNGFEMVFQIVFERAGNALISLDNDSETLRNSNDC